MYSHCNSLQCKILELDIWSAFSFNVIMYYCTEDFFIDLSFSVDNIFLHKLVICYSKKDEIISF